MKTTETNPIVCGTDFSENADATAAVADALARRLGARLILAHSVDECGEFPDHLRTRLMNEDRPRLAEQAGRLRSRGLAFEEKLLRGVPDDGVANFAEQSGARLVVVGASGKVAAEAEAKLRALTPHEADARGVATEVEVTKSRETAGAICAAAERFGADIICIGSHTRPGFTAKALGSVSLAILQNSRRPVLVVWPPAE